MKRSQQMLVVLMVIGAVGAIYAWYNTSLRLAFVEKAILSGQSVTIPFSVNELEDLSKKESEGSGAMEAMQPHISVLITGLGLDKKITEDAISLPSIVALGFSPYAPDLVQWNILAKDHPLFLEIPIDSSLPATTDIKNYNLNTHAKNNENTIHLEWLLEKSSDYVGVYTQADAKTLLSLENISTFLDSLKAHNLLLIYNSSETSELQQLAGSVTLATLEASNTVDVLGDSDAITAQLAEVEDEAIKNGQALVIGNASPATIQLLQEWLGTLEEKGLKIVPVTDIVRKIE